MAPQPPNPIFGVHPGVSSRAAEVSAYHQEFLDSAYPQYAAGWLVYAAAHTNLDAGTALQAYVDQLAVNGLVTSISIGGKSATAAAGQLANDAGKAAPSAITGVPGGTALAKAWDAATALPRFLSMLASGNLWLRIAEVISGVIMLGIGVNALFKGKPLKAVTKTAGVAAKVVPV